MVDEDDDDDVVAEREWPLSQEDCKVLVDAGEDASGLLDEADRNLARRFRRLDTALVKLLDDVCERFPDACYYTGSGGLNLMLGRSHDGAGKAQQDLIAVSGNVSISDGDF